MLKLLLLVVIIWLVYSLLKKYSRSVDRDEQAPDVPASPEDMVRCARCGVHLPRSEAILSGDETFCCEAHRSEHQS
ncbi:MAG: PP0621 family protein [Sulfuricellaceae bacterium]|nr:PP0621 family protein [Sulfuricellaceae bacterium]